MISAYQTYDNCRPNPPLNQTNKILFFYIRIFAIGQLGNGTNRFVRQMHAFDLKLGDIELAKLVIKVTKTKPNKNQIIRVVRRIGRRKKRVQFSHTLETSALHLYH